MQKIGEILNAAAQPTPAATTRRASRPQTTSTAYNELAEWANDAVNAQSWRIRPELALAEESEEQLLALVAENNRRLREVRQQIATDIVEKSLKRHRFETLEIIAAHLKVRAAAVGSSAGKQIEWPDWSDPDIETASVPASEIGGPRGRGIPFPAINCHTIGQTDGGRIVLGRIGSIGSKPVVLCRCSCGRRFLAVELDIIRGGAEHCGPDCPDGKSKPPAHKLLKVFRNMHDRCTNPNHKNFDRYGGRGIRVCPEWSSFDAFAEWAAGSGYTEGLTIDRIDNDGDYTPENCRWATCSEQNNNRSTCIMVEYEGQRVTLKEAAQASGLPYKALLARYHTNGERDLFRPLQKRRRKEATTS